MVFSHRIAALAAVVAIPLGIAATSFALTDKPESPKVPSKVELESPSSSPTPTPDRPTPTPSDEVVSRPPVTDSSAGGDDDDISEREPADDDRGEVGDDG